MPKKQGILTDIAEYEKVSRQMAIEFREGLYQHDRMVAGFKRGRKTDRPRCGALCRNGEACKAPAVFCGARCRMHGGLSPWNGTERREAMFIVVREKRAQYVKAIRICEALA